MDGLHSNQNELFLGIGTQIELLVVSDSACSDQTVHNQPKSGNLEVICNVELDWLLRRVGVFVECSLSFEQGKEETELGDTIFSDWRDVEYGNDGVLCLYLLCQIYNLGINY